MVLRRGRGAGERRRASPICSPTRAPPTSATRRTPDARSSRWSPTGGSASALTYQGTSKDKFTFSWDKQRNFQDQLTGQLETGTIKNEANAGYCQRHEVMQGTLEPAAVEQPPVRRRRDREQVQLRRLRRGPVPVATTRAAAAACQDNVSINDTGLGFIYNGVGNRTMSLSHQSNGRFNVSMLKGEHTMKTGLFWMYGLGGGHRTYTTPRADAGQRSAGVVLVPQRRAAIADASCVAQLHRRPARTRTSVLYVQDQWRLEPRDDHRGPAVRLAARVGAGDAVPAGLLVPAAAFPARNNVPNWKDLNPRLGVVWDPTGDGKTAIKVGINRYVQSNTTGLAQLFDPGRRRRQQHDARGTTGRPRRPRRATSCPTATSVDRRPTASAARWPTPTSAPTCRLNTPDPDWITGLGQAAVQLADVGQRRSRDCCRTSWSTPATSAPGTATSW